MPSISHFVAIVALGAYTSSLMQRMPPPFDDVTAVDIPPARLVLFPGKSNGSKIPADLTGAFAPNNRLKGAVRLFEGEVLGSESVAVAPSGRLVMIDRRGFVYQAVASSSSSSYELIESPLYIGPGRPLGFHLVGEDELYVCDSLKGLLRVRLATGSIEVLSNAVSGVPPQPIHYANDLDIGTDGTVYFTTCTNGPVARNTLGFYDTMASFLLSTMRGAADGRLLAWSPVTGRTSVLATGVAYANGVALSEDESWVAIVETNHARVLRHWLRGPRAGETEVLVDRLPGYPDGISRAPDGGFWVGLVMPLTPMLGLLAPYRWLRQILSHYAMLALPLLTKRWGAVVKLDGGGRPLKALYDLDGAHVATVSAVAERDGRLFLGNLGGNYVSIFDMRDE